MRRKRENEQADFLNHVLGSYIALAVNNPKKYPKKPFLSEEDSKRSASTDEEMEALGRVFAQKIIRKDKNVSDNS